MNRPAIITAALVAAAATAAPAVASDLAVIRAVDRGSAALIRADRDVAACERLAVYEWDCTGTELDRLDAHDRALAGLDRALRDGARERAFSVRLHGATSRYWSTGREIHLALIRGNLTKAQRLIPVYRRQARAMVRAYGVAYRTLDRERRAYAALRPGR